MRVLVRLIPTEMMASMPYLDGLALNPRVVAFAGLISLLAATLFSITPTLRLSSLEIREGMAEGSRGCAVTPGDIGSKLVVLELATAMVLLVGAGLLGKSFYRLLQVEPGFQPDHLVTLAIVAPRTTYGKDEQAVAVCRRNPRPDQEPAWCNIRRHNEHAARNVQRQHRLDKICGPAV